LGNPAAVEIKAVAFDIGQQGKVLRAAVAVNEVADADVSVFQKSGMSENLFQIACILPGRLPEKLISFIKCLIFFNYMFSGGL